MFRDVGFRSDEAQHLLVRSKLVLEIERIVKARGLSQAAAAKAMSVSQTRVSELMRGKVDLFSSDSLIDMLARLGFTVRLALIRSRKVA